MATLHKLGRRTGKRWMLMMMIVLVMTNDGAGDNSYDETYHGIDNDKNSET